ncbi:MAG TPA: hypothetical protein VF988_13190 [Verrucomicrobiae bacterium]
MDAETYASLQACAADALSILKLEPSTEPKTAIEALDAFVYAWQQGARPPAETLSADDAPLILGSLWGELLVASFGWEWAHVIFHDHDDSTAPAVLSPDRSLAVYPIHFLIGCLRDPGVDATIALAFNFMDAGKVPEVEPKEYMNLMDGVHRIVPRVASL